VTQIDALALQQVIDAHAAALTLYARQWCQTPEDAVQEALINLLRQNPAPANVAAWLYTTVRRRAINLARAEGRRAKHQAIAGRQRDYWFAPNDSSLDEPDYEKLLTRLPQLEREIIVARIWGERSFAEIAALVEQPMSTVHRKYQRGLAELEQMINEFEESRQTDESRSPLSR
jgi:RNA polymerase sigma-70 factor (ECF subfamily)